MSRKGKAWAALGVFLFACLVVWAVRTVPQAVNSRNQPLA